MTLLLGKIMPQGTTTERNTWKQHAGQTFRDVIDIVAYSGVIFGVGYSVEMIMKIPTSMIRIGLTISAVVYKVLDSLTEAIFIKSLHWRRSIKHLINGVVLSILASELNISNVALKILSSSLPIAKVGLNIFTVYHIALYFTNVVKEISNDIKKIEIDNNKHLNYPVNILERKLK